MDDDISSFRLQFVANTLANYLYMLRRSRRICYITNKSEYSKMLADIESRENTVITIARMLGIAEIISPIIDDIALYKENKRIKNVELCNDLATISENCRRYEIYHG